MSTGTGIPRRAESEPRRKIGVGRWIVAAVLLFALYAWTFGPYGVVRQARTAQDVRELQRRNDSLRARIRELSDSLVLLKTDSGTIATEARRQGMVLPGEIAVRFVDTSGKR
jgi:cell division protein FtsB